MSILTKTQADKYFESCGNECPFCGNQKIFVSSNVDFDSDYAWRDAGCNDCGENWSDEYRFTAVRHPDSDTEFENEEVITKLSKPVAPDYFELAKKFAEQNGWVAITTKAKYSICKKNANEFNEYAVHTITDLCLEDGHYGYDTVDEAILFAMTKVFKDDIARSDSIEVDGNIASGWTKNAGSFYTQWEEVGEDHSVNIEFCDIKKVENLGVGHWKITYGETHIECPNECEIKCFTLTPAGATL